MTPTMARCACREAFPVAECYQHSPPRDTSLTSDGIAVTLDPDEHRAAADFATAAAVVTAAVVVTVCVIVRDVIELILGRRKP